MKIRDLLLEIGDTKNDWNIITDKADYFKASILIDGVDITFLAVLDADQQYIEFSFREGQGNYKALNKGHRHAVKTISALSKIVRYYIDKYKPTEIFFTSDVSEESRVKLYNTLAKKISKEGNYNLQTNRGMYEVEYILALNSPDDDIDWTSHLREEYGVVSTFIVVDGNKIMISITDDGYIEKYYPDIEDIEDNNLVYKFSSKITNLSDKPLSKIKLINKIMIDIVKTMINEYEIYYINVPDDEKSLMKIFKDFDYIELPHIPTATILVPNDNININQ